MKYKYGNFYTVHVFNKEVIMYNCHLDTQPGDLGPLKGCYLVTSTKRFFYPRSKKRLETSKHPLNGGSGILFELIGINRGMIVKKWYKTSHQKSNKSDIDNQSVDESHICPAGISPRRRNPKEVL